MSHFISGVNLEGSLIFHSTPSQIIKPKMKKFLKSNVLETFLDRKSEDKIIEHVCHRYSQIEEQKLKVEKELFISNKCSVLKRKFMSSFNPKASGTSVSNFFHEDNTSEQRSSRLNMNLKELSAKMPIKLELQKKYSSNINIKMASIQQAGFIYKQKHEYRQWLNQVNNCVNSPNLNKMTFLIQKLASKRQKVKTQTSQIDFPQMDRRGGKRNNLHFLLKENGHSKCYTKKHRKVFTSLDKQRNRLSENDIRMSGF